MSSTASSSSLNASSQTSAPYNPKHRVAVIGAGLSGLVFARHVRDNYGDEVDLSIFESRERLGGRVWTEKDSNPRSAILEAGAEFINEDHIAARQLCTNLGVELLPKYENPEAAPSFATINGPELRDDFREMVRVLREAVIRDRELIKNDPAKRDEFSRMRASDYIQQLNLNPHDLEILNLFVHTEQAVKTAKMSALFLLEWMDFETFGAGHNSLFAAGDDRFRIAGGSSSLIEALAQPLENSISTGTRVTGLFATSTRGNYFLHTNDSRPHIFDSVILAIPASTVKHIYMDPSLGDLQRRLNKFHYSEVEKILVSIANEPLAILERYNQLLDVKLRGLLWQTGQCPAGHNRSWIAVYRGGDNVGYTHARRNTLDMIKDSIHDIAAAGQKATAGRSPTPQIGEDARTYHWTEGGWNQPTLGRGADFVRKTRQNYNGVFPTGEHLARKDPETMSGAIEAGTRTFRHWAKMYFPQDQRLGFICSRTS